MKIIIMIKIRLLIGVVFWLTLMACGTKSHDRYIFFLHNRFIEEHELDESHPEFGRAEYKEILAEFEKSELKIISEKRNQNTDIRFYAQKITTQINSLIKSGVKPNNITIVGTSKGGFIAQHVSTFAKNPELNFVFIGASFRGSAQEYPNLKFVGNILSINEKSDEGAMPISKRIENENLDAKINNFKEIELNTGMGHGFLFKPLNEWIEPTINWANGNYKLE